MNRPIRDYGVIGDTQSVALVSNEGSIDYCSLPYLDSSTVFGALLDDERGGYFSIHPVDVFKCKQEYIPDTPILRCRFSTDSGEAELLDFMDIVSLGDQEQNHALHRCVRLLSGKMTFVMRFVPRPQYAQGIPDIAMYNKEIVIQSGKDRFSLVLRCDSIETLRGYNDGYFFRFSLGEKELAHFDFKYGCPDISRDCPFDKTVKLWRDWLHSPDVGRVSDGQPYADEINRSLITLKLLTFSTSGAMAASGTTSLPEIIGSNKNWDYRFSWLRDSSFTLRAMFSLGHIAEARQYKNWLHTIFAQNDFPKPLYPLHSGVDSARSSIESFKRLS